MPIIYHKSTQTFHLYNDEISYIMKVLPSGHLGQFYYGKRVTDKENFDYLLEYSQRSMAVCAFEDSRTYSLEHIKQEYPTYGTGDMRCPAIDVTLDNGSHIIDLKYKSYRIKNGKPKIKDLPATYVESDEEAVTLEITLYDCLENMSVILSYSIYEHFPVITRNVKVINHSEKDLILNSVMSMSLDLPDKDYEMIELTGAWCRERFVNTRPLQYGIQSIYSLRGHSSHNFNPFIALKRSQCNENSGEVYAFSLVYSGNYIGQVDVDTFNTSRITMGIHPHTFEWKLKTNESFETPEAVMVYSDKGLNYMSQTYHELYRSRLARGVWRDRTRPILINNWEGTFFDFNEDKIVEMAKIAKEAGIELFVLDDGWFTNRKDDYSGLGDWEIDYEKLPNGLSGLAKKINDLGLEFGLWIEPEMVSKGTKLYDEHPEWILHVPNRAISHGRSQYVLDMSNQDVVDYLFNQLKKAIDSANISYIKWDMNRSMSEVYSCTANSQQQGKVAHQYILGVYQLYERLTKEYPNILFESCASGGARFDPGMLYYAPQCWASDDTDAVERIKIQYGTSFVYPLSSIGSHVSATPNHALLRNTPLHTRANVAYFGTFGYELDSTHLTAEELAIIKEQVAFMKEYRELIQFGTFYRLKSPFEGNESAWIVVSSDQSTAIVGYYRVLQEVNVGYRRLKLQGLAPKKQYHVSLLEEECYGDELMNIGIVTSDGSSGENNCEGDYISKIYVLKEK